MNPQFLQPAVPGEMILRFRMDQVDLVSPLWGIPIWLWLLFFFAAGYWLCVALELIDLRRGALHPRRRTTPGTGRDRSDLTGLLSVSAARGGNPNP